MEPLTLATTALALATPYLIKTGEKIAENIGESIWKLISRPFSKEDEKSLASSIQHGEAKDRFITDLIEKINSDNHFRQELENAVHNAQKSLNASQQNITNNGQIEKQVNIQNITGDISF
jgi:hypothetical protein